MSEHVRFHYKDLEDVRKEANKKGTWIPLSENVDCLLEEKTLGKKKVANRLVIQPMEATDGDLEGAPTDLTRRRYDRYASGGAGIIWFESIAVEQAGRSTSNELMITDKNVDDYKRMVDSMKEKSIKTNGIETIILPQVAHSGRYSNPTSQGKEPVVAYHNPVIEKDAPLPESCIITDDGLKRLTEKFVKTTKLCEDAGFDGIDFKCCHGYILDELLSGYTRPGMYGGSFENRTRFHRETLEAIKAELGEDFILSCRFNVFDGIEYPYGFGVKEGCGLTIDDEEPIKFVKLLHDQFGIDLFNVSAGIGYVNTHVLRPYDNGTYIPNEHPFVGLERHMKITAGIKKAVPEVDIVGSAYTYLRQFSPNLAAGMIEAGNMDYAGFGRMAFAYPDFAKDLKETGEFDKKKICVTCGNCATLLRNGVASGCVVRDAEAYKPLQA